MISGKSTVVFASGLIVVAVILSWALGANIPGSRSATNALAGTERAAAPAPEVTSDPVAVPIPESTDPGQAVMATAGNALKAAVNNPIVPSGMGGPQVGLKVHGSWTIEVRNPDGSLATRREFENALSNGASALNSLLARQTVQGLWEVYLSPTLTQYGACLGSGGGGVGCTVAEPASSLTGSTVFKNLTLSLPDSGPNLGKFVLSGNATAQRDGRVSGVFTQVWMCNRTSTLTACADTNATNVGFTQTELSPEIHVLNGQQILVTVVISFS